MSYCMQFIGLFSLILLSTGCYARDDYPLDLYTSGNFPEDHVPALLDAMQAWESATGCELWNYAGSSSDAEFSVEDMNDDETTIYWIDTPVPDTVQLEDWLGEEFFGYCPERDMILLLYHFWESYPEGPITTDAWNFFFARLITHELGHLLGLTHFNEEDICAIMNTSGWPSSSCWSEAADGLPFVGRLDVDAFFSLYGGCP